MRVLSQDGMIDVPYEMVGINIWDRIDQKRNAFCVYAHSNSLNAKEIIMAKYSSQEKAQMAMEMLHNEYRGYKVEEVYHEGTEYYHPIFQFPADEELEG